MKKLLLTAVLLIVALCAAFLNRTAVLTWYAGLFTVHNGTPGADALVVLGGDIETRFPRALELYRQGYAPQILLTDVRRYNPGIPDFGCSEQHIAFALRNHLREEVPVQVVPSRSDGAVSTFDEAWDLLQYSRQNGLKHLIIVTDNNHTRRALYAFRKIFREADVVVEAMGARNAVYSEDNWWRSDRGIKAYVLEPAILALYMFSNRNLPCVNNY